MRKKRKLSLLISILFISIALHGDWLDSHKLDRWLILDEVYDIEYNIC